MKPIGYIVIEHAEEWEQMLDLATGPTLPPGGVLTWPDKARAVFPSRETARAAIDRTEHHRLAYMLPNAPEKKRCKIVPVVAVPASN